MLHRTMLCAALFVAGCSTVENEIRTKAVVDRGLWTGTEYEIRTRTLRGPQGIYEQTSVVYRGRSAVCLPESPNDCDRKIRALLEDYEEGLG